LQKINPALSLNLKSEGASVSAKMGSPGIAGVLVWVFGHRETLQGVALAFLIFATLRSGDYSEESRL